MRTTPQLCGTGQDGLSLDASPGHLGAPSLIPSCLSLPCLANTLPHPDLWKTVGTENLSLPLSNVHMRKHWEDRPILRSSLSRGEVPDVWVGRGPVLHSCHCQQWLCSCRRLDRHTVLSSSCNIGICNSHVPLNCLLLNTRNFSNTSFYLKNNNNRRIKYHINTEHKYWL